MTFRGFLFTTLLLLVALALLAIPGAAFHLGSVLALAPLASRPKKLGTLNFTSGGTDKLTKNNGLGLARYRGFELVFEATFNKAGAASFGTLATEVPFNIIRDVRLFGKSLVQKAPLRFLRQLQHKYLRRADASYAAPTATNTVQTIKFKTYIDAESVRSNFPDGSILDLIRNVNDPSFEVDFGTVEDLIAGGDYTTKTITGATVTVFGILDEQPVLSNFNFSARQVRYIEKPISSAAQTEYPVDIPLGQGVTRILLGQFTKGPEVLISTLVAAAANIRIDVNGKPVWGPYTFQEIQRNNIADTNGLGLDTGYLVIDFLRHTHGNLKGWLDLTNSINAGDANRTTGAQLIFDASSVASAYVGVLVDGLVPPALQAKN